MPDGTVNKNMEEFIKKWELILEEDHDAVLYGRAVIEELLDDARKHLKVFAVINIDDCVPYQLCPKCKGRGKIYKTPTKKVVKIVPCDVCNGDKIILMSKKPIK